MLGTTYPFLIIKVVYGERINLASFVYQVLIFHVFYIFKYGTSFKFIRFLLSFQQVVIGNELLYPVPYFLIATDMDIRIYRCDVGK